MMHAYLHRLAGCGKMRFRNLSRYYPVFGVRAGSRFPTVIRRDSVAELGIFQQPASVQMSLLDLHHTAAVVVILVACAVMLSPILRDAKVIKLNVNMNSN